MSHRTGSTRNLGRLALLTFSVGLLGGCGEEVIATYEERFDATDLGELVADLKGGDLVIEGQRGRTDVELRAELVAWGPRAIHDHVKDDVRIGWEDLDADTSRVIAEIRGEDYDDDDDDHHISLNVRLRVPAELYLDLSHSHGDALVTGVRAVHMNHGSGDLEVIEIERNAVVNDDSGDLAVVRIGGSAFVHDESGDVFVSGISGNVELKDESGDLEARNILGTIRVWDRSGDIDITNANEVIIEEDGSGSVDIR